MTKKELTKAVNNFARKYNFSASTVRDVTVLKQRAITNYKNKKKG